MSSTLPSFLFRRTLASPIATVEPGSEVTHERKKPTPRNTPGCCAASAYSSTSPPTRSGCPSSSHPTRMVDSLSVQVFSPPDLSRHHHCTVPRGEGKEIFLESLV